MLKYMPEAVLTVEILNETSRAGLIYGNAFTSDELLRAAHQLNFQVTRSTVKHSLKSLSDEGLIRRLDTVLESVSTISNSRINSVKGRKPIIYAVRSIEEMSKVVLERAKPRIYEECHPVEPEKETLAKFTPKMLESIETDENKQALTNEINEALESSFEQQEPYKKRAAKRAKKKHERLIESLDEVESTALPDKFPKGNIAEFRRAYAHAIGKKGGKRRYSRRELRDMFGVSNSGLGVLLKEAGWQKEEQFEYGDYLRPNNIMNQIEKQGKTLKGYPKMFVIQRGDDEQTYIYRPESTNGIELQLYRGAKVKMKYQTANLYWVTGDEPNFIEEPYESKQGQGQGNTSSTKRKKEVANELPKAYYGKGYNPVWVACQLKIALRSLGWEHTFNHEREQWDMLNSSTGEILSAKASNQELIEAIIERQLAPPVKEVKSQVAVMEQSVPAQNGSGLATPPETGTGQLTSGAGL